MKKVLYFLILLTFAACGKSPEEMEYKELLDAKIEGKITEEEYNYYKVRKDEENIRSAETNMKKYLELASAENINESVRGKYKKEADYFRRYAKYWKLSGNEQILFARDSLKKSL